MATLVGKTLLSQFRVDAFVAAGGMGSVYRVWDLKRNTPLAMKVLHSELADDPSMFRKFQREARALQKLAHPNIVPFYGIYESGDTIFMLERFVDGPSMKDLLKRHKNAPVPIGEAMIYLKALCNALGYAHTNGVVHCDVKPGNAMLDSTGQIYLTDFGIARHAESATTTIDSAGTSAYMPPEQIRGEPVTPATDVYALGIILYEMLTGRRPFRGADAGTVAAAESTPTVSARIRQEQLTSQAQDPREVNPAISKELADVTLRALHKNAAKRYADATEFFAAVCQALGVTPNAVPDRMPLPENYKKEAQAAAAAQKSSGRSSRVILGIGVVVIGGCLVMALVAAALIFGGGITSDPPTATPFPTFTESKPVFYTSTPNYDATFSAITLTALVPTSTPRPLPTATESNSCSSLRITEKPTSGGMVLEICYPGGKYDSGPWEKGNFAPGPNGKFFVYVASSGKVYAVSVGEGNQIRTLDSLKDRFLAIKKRDDPQYELSFSNSSPYVLYILEKLFNQQATVSIPSWLSNP